MPTCAIVSFRLGLTDGVSVVALRWQLLLERLGFDVITVAGDGPVDRTVAGLGLGSSASPDPDALAAALGDADLVVVENLCTIPLNLPASRAVAAALAGRPAVLHHHDPPWQRERFAHVTELPPDDAAWAHVTINRITADQFAQRGLAATTIYNAFDTTAAPGDRAATRAALGIAADEIVVAHPVRAIERKNIPAAVAIAAELGATYWLLGQPEDGYGPELDRILAEAPCRVIQRRARQIPDIYAAADLVVFPSTWEGFGNPPIEASIHGRPVVVGRYPVADELRSLGFAWHDVDDVGRLGIDITRPDPARIRHNRAVAHRWFSFERIGNEIADLLRSRGWLR